MMVKTNLQYVVDYDYERSQCTCDAYANGDYCRCTTIERSWVTDLNVSRVIDEMYRNHCRTVSDIDKYCFDRICYMNKVYDKDFYDIEACYGYYGEEIRGVWFENEEEVFKSYSHLVSIDTDIDKIRFCLNAEYGYLLDCVSAAKTASVIEVSPSAVFIPNAEHFYKLNKEAVEQYKFRKLPVAVCVKDGDRYKILDGYHRFAANGAEGAIHIIALE